MDMTPEQELFDTDALQQQWARFDHKLDVSVSLNRRLLTSIKLDKVRSPLQRLTWFLIAESLLQAVVVVVLGSFNFDSITTPRFALAGITLEIIAIAFLIALIRQITLVCQIDYLDPITTIQAQLGRLRIWRVRYTQMVFLIAPLVWTPLMIVAFKGFWGLDAYSLFGVPFLAAQLLFGAAVIPLAIWVSKKFSDRMNRSPLIQQLMNDIAGYNLNAATNTLVRLAEFEKEPREG